MASYTMQGEREVHNSLFELKTNPAEKSHGEAASPMMDGGMGNEQTDSGSDEAMKMTWGTTSSFFSRTSGKTNGER